MLPGRLLTSAKHSEKAEHPRLVHLETTWLAKAVTQVCTAAIPICSRTLCASDAVSRIVKAASGTLRLPSSDFQCMLAGQMYSEHKMYTGP